MEMLVNLCEDVSMNQLYTDAVALQKLDEDFQTEVLDYLLEHGGSVKNVIKMLS